MLTQRRPTVFLHGLGITEGNRDLIAADPYCGWEMDGANRGLIRQLRSVYGLTPEAVIENEPGNLRHLMEGHLPALPPASLWFLSYYAPLAASFANGAEPGVPAFASFVAQALLRIRQACGGEKVNLVCHSLGGIVARYALQRTLPQMGFAASEVVERLVTVATPHRGFGGRRETLVWLGRHCGLSRPEVEQARHRWIRDELGADRLAAELDGVRTCAIVGTDNETMRTPFTSGFDGGGDGLVKAKEASWRKAPVIHVYADHSGIKAKYSLLHALLAALEGEQCMQMRLSYDSSVPELGSFEYDFYYGVRLAFDNDGLSYARPPAFPAAKGMYVDVGMNTEQVDAFRVRRRASDLADNRWRLMLERQPLLDVPVWRGPQGSGRHFFQLSLWEFDFNTIDMHRRRHLQQRFLTHDVYTSYFDLDGGGRVDLGHCQLDFRLRPW